LDNAFSPRVRAIEGEGGGLKLRDGEDGFEFFVRKRKEVEWALSKKRK